MTDIKPLFDRTKYSDTREDLLVDAEKIIIAIADSVHISTDSALELILKKSITTNTFYILQTLLIFLEYKYPDESFVFLARISGRQKEGFKEIRRKALKTAQLPDFTFQGSISSAAAEMGLSIRDILAASDKKSIPNDRDAFDLKKFTRRKKREQEIKKVPMHSVVDVRKIEAKCLLFLQEMTLAECMDVFFAVVMIVFSINKESLFLIGKYKSNGTRVRQGDDIVVPRRMMCSLARKAKTKSEISLTNIAAFFTLPDDEPHHSNTLHNIRVHEDIFVNNAEYRTQYFDFLTAVLLLVSKIEPLIKELNLESMSKRIYIERRKEIFATIIGESMKNRAEFKNLLT